MISWRHFTRLAPPALRDATAEKLQQAGKPLGAAVDVESLRAAAARFADNTPEQRFAAQVLRASDVGAVEVQQAGQPNAALVAAAQTLTPTGRAVRRLDYTAAPSEQLLQVSGVQAVALLKDGRLVTSVTGGTTRVWSMDG